MKPWHRRGILSAFSLSFIAAAVIITLYVFRDSVVFFFSPTEFIAQQKYQNEIVRIGGIVREGSIKYSNDRQTVRFIVTDFENDICVEYHGPIPSLFKEGSGTVVLGKMGDEVFIARELLAKHDENYMPKEVADILKDKGYWQKDYS